MDIKMNLSGGEGTVSLRLAKGKLGPVVDVDFLVGGNFFAGVSLAKEDCSFGSRLSKDDKATIARQSLRMAERFEDENDRAVVEAAGPDILKAAAALLA